MVDANRLRESWAKVAAHGDQVPLRFYGRLFVAHPELRDLFPMSMAVQRDRLVAALGLVVSQAHDLDVLRPALEQLGREHRRFATEPGHYAAVGEALLFTLADLLDDQWTAELAADWAAAYTSVAEVMLGAAEKAKAHFPAWWEAEVVLHERRTFDVAVVVIHPDQPYDYQPGQSLPVESSLRPQHWRYYSPANAPRPDGTIELHVRREPGGQLSAALVDQVQPGDVLRLGAPVGHLTLQRNSIADPRDLLLIAGGTGLAPLKALVDQLDRAGGAGGRRVRLFVGARTVRELYDLDSLRVLEERLGWLSVVPAVADDTHHRFEAGDVVDVALRRVPDPGVHDVYLCGSGEMVSASLDRLRKAGCAPAHVHYEGFLGLTEEISGGAAHLEHQR